MDFISFLNRYPFLKQFCKFCLVGGTAALISFSIYYSFTEYLKMWYIYSSVCSFIISAVFNFLANKFWTFANQERGKQAITQMVKFFVVVFLGLVINTLIIYVLTDWQGIDYRLSWVFATGTVTFWNFGFNRFWTFKHHHSVL
ncbi:MAG: GtrA family protein [Patescibacteria group bacterium]|jgi:putative flippase GtrA